MSFWSLANLAHANAVTTMIQLGLSTHLAPNNWPCSNSYYFDGGTIVVQSSCWAAFKNQGLIGDMECAAILETPLPLGLLFPSCFTHPYKCKQDPAVATVRCPGQELHNSHLQAPVWSETARSSNQRHKANKTLPGVAVPPRSQYPVSWSKHCGIWGGDRRLWAHQVHRW